MLDKEFKAFKVFLNKMMKSHKSRLKIWTPPPGTNKNNKNIITFA